MPCARHQFSRDPGDVGVKLVVFFYFAYISQEICDSLSIVLSTVKTIHAFKPERIFFWLRADWTIVGTLGVGIFTLATIIYQQVCHVMLFRSRERFLSCQTLYYFLHDTHAPGTKRRRLSSHWRRSRLCQRNFKFHMCFFASLINS